MGEELVQFVGVFFLSVFSIFQWLGAHYACFGQDGGTCLGHFSWKKSTEGPQWSLPVVVLAQCVCLFPVFQKLDRWGVLCLPVTLKGRSTSPWFPHLLSGVSDDVRGKAAGPDHRYRDTAAQGPQKREMHLPWISHPKHCLPIYVLSSFPCIVLVFYAHRNNTRIIPVFFHVIKKTFLQSLLTWDLLLLICVQ